MDNRPIGVFDSGLGGLTAVARLRKILPNESLVYLADTARVPYGEKSRQQLLDCAKGDISFLLGQNVKMILIACGTVSSLLTPKDFAKIPVPTLGVVYPAVLAAAEQTKSGKIGVLGTEASIRAGAYRACLLEKMPSAEVFTVACPKFVPLIESGKFSKEDSEVKAAVCEYLLPIKEANADTLILGCTHYPLLSEAIEEFLPSVRLINVGAQAAEQVKQTLWEQNMLSEKGAARNEFFVSGDVECFVNNASLFLGSKITNAKKAVL